MRVPCTRRRPRSGFPGKHHRHELRRHPVIVPRLRSTSFRTFIVYPALVVAWELALNRGDLRFDPWFSPLLAWGFLQYWLIGRYRLPLGGGGPGMDTPPE